MGNVQSQLLFYFNEFHDSLTRVSLKLDFIFILFVLIKGTILLILCQTELKLNSNY